MGSSPAATEAIRFGKYSLVARLATGGMAEIFLGRLQGAAGFEKLVCIKRILPHLARDRQFVAMFLNEARIAARISHPNVCQVFELGEIEGSYYIAMEYLEGVPLACFRNRRVGPADPRLVAGIGVQACEALHHAHQLKNTDGGELEVVHRDVSPQNVFVTVDGIVKVLDFGIAKIQDATIKTGTGAIKGTYAYMAPEQLRGERVDRRTDVFALGIVLWETLIGRHLFRRDTEFLTFQAITTDPIAEVSALRPDVPAALSGVIRTALSRDRAARFPTARMFGEAIAAAVAPLAPSAISEQIAEAFPGELGDQAALIRVARQGGAFSLDVERGPAVEGTDLLTTPTSNQFPLADVLAAFPAGPAPAAAPGPAASSVRPRPPIVRWLAIAALSLLVAGGGAYLFRTSHRPKATSPITAALPVSPPVDAATPAVAPTLPVDAAPVDPMDASAVDAALPVAPPPRPSEAVRSRPTGPPGVITIDASPYAVIYIDGKSYGETPLVALELAPGSHHVRAVAASGATREYRVTIEPGKTARTLQVQWDSNRAPTQ